MSMSSDRGPSSSTTAVAGGRGGRCVRDAAVAAECEVDDVRRSEQEAFVPRPWRSGTIATSGGLAPRESAEQRRRRPRATRPAGRPGGRAGPSAPSASAAARACARPPLRPRPPGGWRVPRPRARAARPRRPGVTTIVSAMPGRRDGGARACARASRSTRSRRSSASRTSPSRDFAPLEVPDRDDRDDAIGAQSRRRPRARRAPRRRGGLGPRRRSSPCP